MKHLKTTVALTAALLALTACGSSNSASNASAGGAKSGAATSATITLPTPAKPASGTPIKVFYFNEEGASASASDPNGTFAAKAAVEYINRNLGGVNGRPITMQTCASLGTPESSVNCANKAVDWKADIVIKGLDPDGEGAVPIVTGAGIPYLTLNAGAPAELDNPLSFVPASGYGAEYGAFAEYAKAQGYKRVVAIYTNVAALSAAVDGDVTKAFSRAGIGFSSVPVDISTADLTSAYNTALSKKPDLILAFTSLAQCTATVQARGALSDSTPLAWGPSCNVQSVYNTISPSQLGDTYIATGDTSAIPSDKDSQTYTTAMSTYEPKGQAVGFAATSFAAVMDFYNAAKEVADPSTLNAATIAKQLQTSPAIPLFGGAGKSYSCAAKPFAEHQSACSPWAFIVKRSTDNSYSLTGSYDMAPVLK